MKNPTQGKRLTSPKSNRPASVQKQNNVKVRQAVKGLTKQIDRVRKQIQRLERDAPYSPALQRAKQFMQMNNITSISQTRYIQNAQQYAEYKRFLNKFEKYDTHTVTGAKEAQAKQLDSLKEIMRQNGWDPNQYSVEDFYNQLNKLDLYRIMTDFAITSDKVISEVTHMMNTANGKRVTAQQLLYQIFGTRVSNDARGKAVTNTRLSGYNKTTKAYQNRKKR